MLHNMRKAKLLTIAATTVLLLLLGSCGGGSDPIIERAGAFIGGALSSFGGADSPDAGARNTAMEIAISRIYDLTPGGFTLLTGPATTVATGIGNFGGGNGNVDLAGLGQQATITLNISADDPRYSSVEMDGVFNPSEAQTAIDLPGASFIVEWTITWEDDGLPYILTAVQSLAGTDWL